MAQAVVWTGLFHGGVLCTLMSIIIVGSLVQDPRIWVGSGPRDMQQALGHAGPDTLRRKRAWGMVMMVVLVGVFWHLVEDVLTLDEGPGQLANVAGASWLAFQVFNLYDAAIIDVEKESLKLVQAIDRASTLRPAAAVEIGVALSSPSDAQEAVA